MRLMTRLMGLSLKSGKRRRRAVPLWRSRWALGAVVALALGASAGGGEAQRCNGSSNMVSAPA